MAKYKYGILPSLLKSREFLSIVGVSLNLHSLVVRNDNPSVFESEVLGSAIRGLEHNPLQHSLLAAGSSDAQVDSHELASSNHL